MWNPIQKQLPGGVQPKNFKISRNTSTGVSFFNKHADQKSFFYRTLENGCFRSSMTAVQFSLGDPFVFFTVVIILQSGSYDKIFLLI